MPRRHPMPSRSVISCNKCTVTDTYEILKVRIVHRNTPRVAGRTGVRCRLPRPPIASCIVTLQVA